MRLIDADRFKAVNGMKDDCADCDKELRGKSKACEFDRIYTKMDFCGWLDDAPTVDAVPVDDVFGLAIALSKGIEVLELPTRVYNALSRSAYYTVADVYRLWKSGNLKKMWNLGDKSIGAIENRLCAYLPYLWQTEGRLVDGTAEKT